MLGFKILFSLIATLSFTARAEDDSPKEIRWGLQPNEAKADLNPLATLLKEKLGLPVKIIPTSDYHALVKGFQNKEFDFATFSALNYVRAEREASAKVLLKYVYNADFYYSAILTLKNSKVKNLKDLKGKTFGFIDQSSTSGYLVPTTMLQNEGLRPDKDYKFQFLGTHKAAIEALLAKKVDAIGVWASTSDKKTGAWTEEPFLTAHKNAFHVLKISKPLPNDAFSVREDFFKKNPILVYKMMEALIQISEMPSPSPLKKVLNLNGMTTATSKHYDPIRELEKGVTPKP